MEKPVCVGSELDKNMNQGKTKADWFPALKYRHADDDLHNSTVGGNVDRIAFYDKHADSYADDHSAMGYTGPSKAAELLHKYINGKVDTKIFDVGCGDGNVLKELHKLAPYNNVHGLDPSKSMLEKAQREDPYQKVYQQFFKIDCGIEHNSFDAVVCCGAFIPGHLGAGCLKEMYDLVRAGGYVVNVMRGILLDVDEDFKKMRPLAYQLQEEGKLEVVGDYMYPNYFAAHDGHVFVLKKIK